MKAVLLMAGQRSGGGAPRADAVARPVAGTSTYLRSLTWAFALFNSVRTLSYLPALWAIHASGRSDQHSLVTWIVWTGANATMAAWLYEQNGRRPNRAIVVVVGNAVMCGVTSLAIVWYRLHASN